jgi:hypothetical protein
MLAFFFSHTVSNGTALRNHGQEILKTPHLMLTSGNRISIKVRG